MTDTIRIIFSEEFYESVAILSEDIIDEIINDVRTRLVAQIDSGEITYEDCDDGNIYVGAVIADDEDMADGDVCADELIKHPSRGHTIH